MTQAEREDLILSNSQIVRRIALRLARRLPAHVELDEVISTGMIGLIDAVDRYDPSRGVPFTAYAEIRVRGAMIDAMREMDWVPRAVRRQSTQLTETRTRLQRSLGRSPTRDEMAGAMELQPAVYDAACRAGELQRLVPLDAPMGAGGEQRVVDTVADASESAVDRWIAAEEMASVFSALEELPERERTVVVSYYQNGTSLKNIGASLGVTEARACQLRGQGVRHLRERLERQRAA